MSETRLTDAELRTEAELDALDDYDFAAEYDDADYEEYDDTADDFDYAYEYDYEDYAAEADARADFEAFGQWER